VGEKNISGEMNSYERVLGDEYPERGQDRNRGGFELIRKVRQMGEVVGKVKLLVTYREKTVTPIIH